MPGHNWQRLKEATNKKYLFRRDIQVVRCGVSLGFPIFAYRIYLVIGSQTGVYSRLRVAA